MKRPKKPRDKHFCSECGKRKECVWSWKPGGWSWTCWRCLEAEEDGYAVRLG